jgi:putative YhdH/YhfP family quinone oxidoreductase
VKLLAKLGYSVVAVTGKPQLEARLKSWGASRIICRSDVVNDSDKPMLSTRWTGAVDTVGGDTLTTLLRETKPYGVVAACGLVGGVNLPLTVHPFILRGVTLAGIGSALLPLDRRQEIWRHLSTDWRLDNLEELATTTPLENLEPSIQQLLQGQIIVRTVVILATDN